MTGTEAKALREATGLNYDAWAQILGVTAQTVRNIETGHRPAGKALEQLWKIIAQRRKKRIKAPIAP